MSEDKVCKWCKVAGKRINKVWQHDYKTDYYISCADGNHKFEPAAPTESPNLARQAMHDLLLNSGWKQAGSPDPKDSRISELEGIVREYRETNLRHKECSPRRVLRTGHMYDSRCDLCKVTDTLLGE